ncbi:TadE family protein [Salinibacillus xinjiangensis]|uniref:Pilus assembly protein n=1 Tax=Salinibacillus xinjiangensis TaxID=1229268 RepID=A0A6G1X905_9BACI|nr:TadE family protein [Salinibacillus xinjiangensis]MRG87386.1 pilus assembly protein [Salinibacillus xinjiangensis]
MRKLWAKIRKEDGAVSLEFIGIIPFFFMFFLILWQVVASGYAVYTMKTAANEGAKTYSITQNINKTEDTVKAAINSTSVLNYEDMRVIPYATGEFELIVEVNHPLVFVPDEWKPSTAVDLEETTVSQVLVE